MFGSKLFQQGHLLSVYSAAFSFEAAAGMLFSA